jgi:hypothetical protein
MCSMRSRSTATAPTACEDPAKGERASQEPDAAAEARESDGASPPEIERHITAVKSLLGVYVILFVVAWYFVLTADSGRSAMLSNLPFWIGAPVYVALIVECAIVQQRLFAARLGKHRGWQVVVGGMILNPCLLGWWIPMSVLIDVGRARIVSEELEGRGRSTRV